MLPTPAVPTASPTAQPLTFREHAEAWFARHASTWKPATRTVYMAVTRAELVPMFGETTLGALTRGTIRAGLDAIQARGLSASSMIRLRAIIQSMLADAVERDLIDYNPARDVRAVRPKRTRRLVIPTVEELGKLRAAAAILTPDRAMFFRVLDGAALRVGECQALRPEDFEPTHGRLRIARTIRRTVRVPGEPITDTPKNGKTRFVELPDSLCRDLAGFVAARRESDWLFPGRFGEPLTYPPLAESMRTLARAAGVDGMTVHGFRHARISAWIAAGADLEWVRRQAGHHSIAFTIARYGAHMKMRDQAVLRDLPPARRDGADENPPMP